MVVEENNKMDYQEEYKNFIDWISDPKQMGKAGIIKITDQEASTLKLFVAFLNQRYPPKYL